MRNMNMGENRNHPKEHSNIPILECKDEEMKFMKMNLNVEHKITEKNKNQIYYVRKSTYNMREKLSHEIDVEKKSNRNTRSEGFSMQIKSTVESLNNRLCRAEENISEIEKKFLKIYQ